MKDEASLHRSLVATKQSIREKRDDKMKQDRSLIEGSPIRFSTEYKAAYLSCGQHLVACEPAAATPPCHLHLAIHTLEPFRLAACRDLLVQITYVNVPLPNISQFFFNADKATTNPSMGIETRAGHFRVPSWRLTVAYPTTPPSTAIWGICQTIADT